MTAAAVVHIGPRAAAEVGYDLAAEDRAGRWEDWRHDAAVRVPAEALDAEARLIGGAPVMAVDGCRRLAGTEAALGGS